RRGRRPSWSPPALRPRRVSARKERGTKRERPGGRRTCTWSLARVAQVVKKGDIVAPGQASASGAGLERKKRWVRAESVRAWQRALVRRRQCDEGVGMSAPSKRSQFGQGPDAADGDPVRADDLRQALFREVNNQIERLSSDW